ncbi:MAG: endolytic transglycosylase MltG, partial [Candidatus Binataceae bacterium]
MKVKIAAVIIALLVAGVLAGLGSWYLLIAPGPPFPSPRIVTVKRGDSLRIVAAKLKRNEVIRSSLAMIVWAEITGQARGVKPGDYQFRGGERIPDVMRHLINGDYLVVTVAIPEGLTVRQIAARLEQAGLACQGAFERAAGDGAIVKSLGFGPLGVEGYLFPATYRFPPHVTAEQVLATMLARFYAILTPAVEERMFALNLNTRQMVTMASIVEKEAKVPGERPIIASVFYNRLKLGIPLQSDPTAQYNFEGKSEPAAIAVHMRSLFNTYDFPGLPPGPIANPGMSSIMAVLYPAQTDYLYFVARGDGTHIFSHTLK